MRPLVAYLIAETISGETFVDPKSWPKYETVDAAAQAWFERPDAPFRVLRDDGSIDYGFHSEVLPVFERLAQLRATHGENR